MKNKTKVVWVFLVALVLAAAASMFLMELGEEASPARSQEEVEDASPESPQTDSEPPPPPQAAPPLGRAPRVLRGPASDRLDIIDQLLEQMEWGRIAFNSPDSINVKDSAVIHLVLGVAQEMDELKQRIEAEGERVGAQVRVSELMEARLTGPNFTITAITPELQAVSRNQPTEWRWEVSPTLAGRHSLHLTLSAVLTMEGSSVPRTIRTFDRVIEVEVTWPQRVGSFVADNWQWLWAAILVPVAGWLWRRKKRAEAD